MNTEPEQTQDLLLDATRANLKDLSKAMLRLHKTLLDAAKVDHEAKNGRIESNVQYFQLVIDDAHFAWLRKISALIALIDEAVSVRRPATETEAQGLYNEAKLLLNFQDGDAEFNDKFQTALQTNNDAVLNYNATIVFVNSK